MRSDQHVARRWSPWIGKPPIPEGVVAAGPLPMPMVVGRLTRPIARRGVATLIQRLPSTAAASTALAGAKRVPLPTQGWAYDLNPVRRRRHRPAELPPAPAPAPAVTAVSERPQATADLIVALGGTEALRIERGPSHAAQQLAEFRALFALLELDLRLIEEILLLELVD